MNLGVLPYPNLIRMSALDLLKPVLRCGPEVTP
jgi:hypothetical protein